MDDWLRSDAIEGAAVMIYAVSLAYKESSNCRLEANYAHQQELDMMPLMMTKGKTLFLQSPHLMVTFGPPLADIVFVRFGLSERMCLLLRVRVITNPEGSARACTQNPGVETRFSVCPDVPC